MAAQQSSSADGRAALWYLRIFPAAPDWVFLLKVCVIPAGGGDTAGWGEYWSEMVREVKVSALIMWIIPVFLLFSDIEPPEVPAAATVPNTPSSAGPRRTRCWLAEVTAGLRPGHFHRSARDTADVTFPVLETALQVNVFHVGGHRCERSQQVWSAQASRCTCLWAEA